MSGFTAPSRDELVKDLDRVTRFGVKKAQEQSLTGLTAILNAVREIPEEADCSLETLLRKAVETSGQEGPGECAELLYGLDGIDLAAEARYAEIGEKIGLSQHTVGRERRRDWNLAVATRLLAIMEEASVLAAGRIPVSDELRERLGKLSAVAALHLAAAQLPDGSWPLRVGEPGCVGDISLTAWAASALHKVLDLDADSIAPTRKWIADHHNPELGGFGAIDRGDHPPGFPTALEIQPSPRETASAIKILNQLDSRPERRVGRGVHYLVQHTSKGKGWPASGDMNARGHLLTTAYVLDALLAVTPNVRHLAEVLDEQEYALIDDRLEGKVHDGLDWVALEQKDEGGWGNNGSSEPYVTAQVVCFLHQLITQRERVRDRAIRYLGESLDDGGLPAEVGGKPEIGPTAMMVFGLLRGTTAGCEEELADAVNFLGRAATERSLPRLDVYSATFALLLGGQEWRLTASDWRPAALRALESHRAAREDGGSPEEIADRTLDGLPPMFDSSREALVTILRGSCP